MLKTLAKLSIGGLLIWQIIMPLYQNFQKTGNVINSVSQTLSKKGQQVGEIVALVSKGGNQEAPEAKIDINVIKATLAEVSLLKVNQISGTIITESSITGVNEDWLKNLFGERGKITFANEVLVTGETVFDLSGLTITEEQGNLVIKLPSPKVIVMPVSNTFNNANTGSISEPDKIKLQVFGVLSKPENASYFYSLLFKSKTVNSKTINTQALSQAEKSLKGLLSPVTKAKIKVIMQTPVLGYSIQDKTDIIPFGTFPVSSGDLNTQLKQALFTKVPSASVSILPQLSETKLSQTTLEVQE
jgi:hypothetical protein